MTDQDTKFKSPEEIEKEQEELLKSKYGALKPKNKKGLMPKEHKYFDSADWAMAKEGSKKGDMQVLDEVILPPKLEPSQPPQRRISNLDPEVHVEARFH